MVEESSLADPASIAASPGRRPAGRRAPGRSDRNRRIRQWPGALAGSQTEYSHRAFWSSTYAPALPRACWLDAFARSGLLRPKRSTRCPTPDGRPLPARRSRRPIRRVAAVRCVKYEIGADRPVLVVTGGSQGSLAINRIVAEWLRGGGATTMQVIWATGRATHHEFAALHDPPDVHVLPFIEPMADAWSVADLCVARAGMMTLAELCAWGIPSVLIPLPSAASDHQTHNARAMASAGAAVVLPQAGLDAAALAAALHDVLATESRLDVDGCRGPGAGQPRCSRTYCPAHRRSRHGRTMRRRQFLSALSAAVGVAPAALRPLAFARAPRRVSAWSCTPCVTR